ncbi:glycoside-pentoside-hexuronide (GPH):cation symporter [Paucilactobacillus kaifaensis]|uniref:glycoside-pentoside-hexuronide (GPH):cation symporter n=1 Tax=Paucilactobacillus kaifaensis TaxID=2559921 RepID=UPI0010F9E345|nr:glycoside-pentoside-hexuronide (GPH):cation symporter [Paucilactobacillus kaifaensis]
MSDNQTTEHHREPSLPQKITDINYSKQIPVSQKIAYGFGDFGNGFMFDLGQAYLTKFWTDAAGIGAGVVAGIFAFTKIFDAFMDPIAGSIIDNRKNIGPQGKFRPTMMISAVILGIMTVVTFTMPMGLSPVGKIIFAYAAYMIWGLVYSFTNDPYGSLASVMSRNPQDRSFMATSRQIGSVAAQFIAGVAFIPLMEMLGGGMGSGNERHGYFWAATIFAVLGVVMFLICFLGTKENVKVHRDNAAKPEGFKDYFKIVFTNGPLFAIILMTLFTISAMNTNNTMMVYFAQYNLGNINYQPLVNSIMMGVSIVGIFSIPMLTKWFGKKKVTVVCLIISGVANLLNFVLPTNPITFIILITIGYTALCIPNGITWAYVSDVIDYGEWHTGMRKEAITYAAFNFSRKLAQSLAAIVSAGILAITGYIANGHQSASTLLGIKGAMTLYPGACMIIAAIVIGFLYKLNDEKFKKVATDLDNGKWEKGNIGDKDNK